MGKKKYLILSIVFAFVLAISISGGTFALLQWTITDGTGVRVTVGNDAITMHIEPEETSYTGLRPTSNCQANAKYSDTLVTIVNNTGALAIPSFRLKARVIKGGSGTLTSDVLRHIHYSVVPLETTVSALGKPVKGGVVSGYSCSNPPSGNEKINTGGTMMFANAEAWNSHLTLESVDLYGNWTNIPNYGDEMHASSQLINYYLPRQYYYGGTKDGEVEGITFRGEAYSTSYQYFRIYVWIDSDYVAKNYGDEIIDPLQKSVIEVTWSDESIVEQVPGNSNENNYPAAGLYNSNDELIYTWAQLISNGDISVGGSKLTDSNRNLTGTLVISKDIRSIDTGAFASSSSISGSSISKVVIPNTINNIQSSAFSGSSLTEVVFESNSSLITLGGNAFSNTNITSFTIPSSVTRLNGETFYNCQYLETITYEGTMAQFWEIYIGSRWLDGTLVSEIVCSDGVISVDDL